MVRGWFYEGSVQSVLHYLYHYMGWCCQLIFKLVVVLGRVIRVSKMILD